MHNSINKKCSLKEHYCIDIILVKIYYVRVKNNANKKLGGESLNTKERPSQLTEAKRTETTDLVNVFEQIQDDTARRIVMAFIEGVAAAAAVSPKITA